ncbi:MAG: alpha/beta hydrolase [Planctomycetota bacterium]|nr:MAG: alpha/beta hydrolase [Planctomycetota bacterium]
MDSHHPSQLPTDADTPAPKPKRRWWLRILINLAVFYILWCIALYFYQDRLLFPADLAPAPYAGERYDTSTVVLKRPIAGGEVVAWYVPPLNRARPAPLVVFFHGNAEIIDDQSRIILGYQRMGFGVLLPEYRGYGRSDGSPGEAALVDDAQFFFDEIVNRRELDAGRIVFHGRSLGGGVAAGLADRRRPSALVLESTFTSVSAMARHYYAPAFIAKNPFRVDRVIASLDVPVLILHGTTDDIIPVAHGRKLRDLALRGTYHEYDCRHNDFPGDANEEAYWRDIEAFLRAAGVVSGPAAAQSREAGS